MKDAEDEAFDELAKRQGHWGGGYHAKRQMAADKLQEPAQEPVARVTGMSFGRFIVEPLNPAMVLPVGMALYSSPQGNLYPCCALRTSDIHTCIPPEEEYD
jgi:hypothetical protein